MRNILILSMVFVLVGCGTISNALQGTRAPNCYERVAISKIALKEAYETAAKLNDEEMITLADAERALIVLDQSDAVVDNASALCALDEAAAFDYIDQAASLIDAAGKIMREGQQQNE